MHVCDGKNVPSPVKQVELGRAAIAVYLQEINVWKPSVQHVNEPPESIETRGVPWKRGVFRFSIGSNSKQNGSFCSM